MIEVYNIIYVYIYIQQAVRQQTIEHNSAGVLTYCGISFETCTGENIEAQE